MEQSTFEFKQRGGARPGAGRKRVAPRPLVPHRSRPKLSGRHPLHVTLHVVEGVQSLRSRGVHDVVRAALREGADRLGLRVVHYGAASNHLHLVCEAESEQALARGMKGLAYVFGNARKHGAIVTELLDPCTSANCFDGWIEVRGGATWLARARTWLLTVGWRRRGLLSTASCRAGRRLRVRRSFASGRVARLAWRGAPRPEGFRHDLGCRPHAPGPCPSAVAASSADTSARLARVTPLDENSGNAPAP